MVTDSWLSRSKSSEPKIAISEAFNFSMLFTFASRNLRKLNEFLVFRQKLFLLPKKKNLKLKNFTIWSKCFTSTDQKMDLLSLSHRSLVNFATARDYLMLNLTGMRVVMVKAFLEHYGSLFCPHPFGLVLSELSYLVFGHLPHQRSVARFFLCEFSAA